MAVSAPSDSSEVRQSDRAFFDAVRTEIINGEVLPASMGFDSPYTLEVAPLGVMTIMEEHEMSELLYQMHDELVALVAAKSKLSNRATPVSRGVADAVYLPYETAAETIAPSNHVVMALYLGDVLKSDESAEVRTQIDEDVESLIKRGVSYGLYSESDIAVSRELYRTYKAQALANQPELSMIFNPE